MRDIIRFTIIDYYTPHNKARDQVKTLLEELLQPALGCYTNLRHFLLIFRQELCLGMTVRSVFKAGGGCGNRNISEIIDIIRIRRPHFPH